MLISALKASACESRLLTTFNVKYQLELALLRKRRRYGVERYDL